jgi:DNA helicase-2/ATP-dependent DNA helicase PcrA
VRRFRGRPTTLTLVDEAQDLSYLNHYILGKIVKRKRLIAVGDPCQAIYGFRGADADSMNRLQQKFDMKALYLTVSFRCGKKITENAQWRAPDMTSPEWAQEGEVHRKASWHIDEIEDGDAIVCRNNAPLFSLAIKLLKAGRLPEIAGRDIAAPIIKLMGKLGKDNLSSGAALAAVEEWKERELKRARDSAKRLVHDKADIMKIMLEQTQTLGDAKAYLQSLVDRDGRVYLMTGHKSKGLEFDRVWFLDPQLIKKKEDQDANIQYVIETRPKKFLAYVTSDTFEI